VNDSVYFDGDPATDSARRHMERVLKGEPARRWPWLLAAAGTGAVWMLYRVGRTLAAEGSNAPPAPGPQQRDGRPGTSDQPR